MKYYHLFIILVVLVFMQSCGGGSGVENTPSESTGADFSLLNSIPVDQTVLLNIPTYDGSGQVVHPDVIIKDHQFKMAITPYAYSDLDLENPSFYVSDDGINFQPPPGLENPIIDHPNNGYNDDPDLIYNVRSNQYYIYYNETPYNSNTHKRDRQYLSLLSSSDTIDWTDKRVLAFNFGAKDPFVVSPAVIVSNGTYYLFHVEIDTANDHYCGVSDPHQHTISVFTSPDGLSWDKSNDTGIAINLPPNFNPWHLNVIQNGSKFYMLVNGYEGAFCNNHNLYMAVSDDLIHWNFIQKPLIRASKELYNSRIIYRSAGVINGDDLFIYFSFETYGRKWLLGLKHMSLKNILGGS